MSHLWEYFLVTAFLEPNYDYFKYSYTLNDRGEIIGRTERHFTGRNQYETDRYRRIAIDSVYDYSEKDNRNNRNDLNSNETAILNSICSGIESGVPLLINKQLVIGLIEKIQNRIIYSL